MITIGASDVEERAVLDARFGSGNPATWYWGLSTTTPNDDGTGFTEPVGGSYARVTQPNNATAWPAATTTSGVTTKANGTAITWPNPTGTWGTCTHVGAFTAVSGGTPSYTFELVTASRIISGITPVEYAIAGLKIKAD